VGFRWAKRHFVERPIPLEFFSAVRALGL